MEEAARVLSYWFDGDSSINYKTKWFPSSSESIQRDADVAVNNHFGALFHSIVINAPNLPLEYEQWTNDKYSCLALIIAVDQFSRHIYRLQELSSDSIERKNADLLALELSKSIVQNHMDWLYMQYNIPQFVFALMPFRHNGTIDRLESVINAISKREEMEHGKIDLLVKFRKQTVRRLQHLQDRHNAEVADGILEREEFVADETNIMTNKLVIATDSFLKKQFAGRDGEGMNTVARDGEGMSTVARDGEGMSTVAKGEGMNTVAISLSGGVDSMVISKILILLQRQNKNIGKIVAVHIDYANRDESSQEADYVEGWCDRLGITFYKRVINEVTRGITNRDEYEKVSRDIRYGFYQEIIALERCDAVIFGHHKGDVQENVISNVMHGLSPLVLSGMGEVGIANNVVVWRPLLAYSKDDIYNFAHQYGVPYFKDTTPSWSTRGKLRRLLVPLLIDMYGEGCLNNLTALAHQSDESRALVHNAVYKPFLNSINRYKCGISVNVLPFLHQPIMFWKEMLKEIMHSMSMSMVREKSVQNFIERLQRLADAKDATSVSGWIELRKLFYTYLDENGVLIVFKESVFAPITERIVRKTANGRYKMWDRLQRFRVPIMNENMEIMIGTWKIDVTTLDINVNSDEEQQPENVVDLLQGSFSYHLTFPVDVYSHLGIYVDYKYDQKDLIDTDNPATEVFSVFNSPFLTRKDMRIKRGIPFLVPLMRDVGGVRGKNKSCKTTRLPSSTLEKCITTRFSYSYME